MNILSDYTCGVYILTVQTAIIFFFIFIAVIVPLFPQDGWTAIMFASHNGHADVVQLLLSSGALVDIQDMVR